MALPSRLAKALCAFARTYPLLIDKKGLFQKRKRSSLPSFRIVNIVINSNMSIAHQFTLTHDNPDYHIDLRSFLYTRSLFMVVTCKRMVEPDSKSIRKVISLGAFGYFTGTHYDISIDESSVMFRNKYRGDNDVFLTVKILDPIELHERVSFLEITSCGNDRIHHPCQWFPLLPGSFTCDQIYCGFGIESAAF